MGNDLTDTPLASLRSFMEDLRNEVVIARNLIETGHTVDLRGLDGQMGLLCAKALDLPPEEGRSLRPPLISLLGVVEALIEALASRGQ